MSARNERTARRNDEDTSRVAISLRIRDVQCDETRDVLLDQPQFPHSSPQRRAGDAEGAGGVVAAPLMRVEHDA